MPCISITVSNYCNSMQRVQHSASIFYFSCVSVRGSVMSVCISQKPHIQIPRDFLCMLTVVMVRSSPDDNGVRYVFPVLWMTSFSHNGPNTDRRLRRRSKLFTVTRQVAPLNYAPGAKSAIANCPVIPAASVDNLAPTALPINHRIKPWFHVKIKLF